MIPAVNKSSNAWLQRVPESPAPTEKAMVPTVLVRLDHTVTFVLTHIYS